MRKLLAIAVAMAPLPAAAQSSGSVQFDGFIIGTCAVVVGGAGTLVVNGAGDDLSSTNAGGAPATASITTTSTGYFVHVDQPTGFSLAPSGQPGDTVFTASYSASGATTASGVLHTVGTALGLGLTNLDVDAGASTASATFPAGLYQLPVTVRCATS